MRSECSKACRPYSFSGWNWKSFINAVERNGFRRGIFDYTLARVIVLKWVLFDEFWFGGDVWTAGNVSVFVREIVGV